MIALLAHARSRIADALDSRRLARTVRILQRQLDHAHLAGQIEEARADRAEERASNLRECAEVRGIALEKAEERVAELETQLADWRLQSGALVAEQAADDLPDLAPADDSGPPSPLPADPYARAEIQAKRADAAERHRLAAEAHAADLESELATTRVQLRQTERSAGAHLATIERLQEQIAAAHRAAHAPARSLRDRADIARRAWDGSAPADPDPVEWDDLSPAGQAAWQAVVRACDTSAAPAEQIPGVAAADALTESERREGYQIGKQTGIGFAAGCQAIAESKARKKAAADTPPETRPSARIATREEPRP